MAITVRRATLDDLPLLVRHRRGMFEDMAGYAREHLDFHDINYRRWAEPRLKTGALVGFVAMKGRKPVASGCLWLREKQPAPEFPGGVVPYLLSMFTERDERGKGAATKIVKEALKWAKYKHYPLIYLHASNMGKGMYEKLEFERTWEMQLKLA